MEYFELYKMFNEWKNKGNNVKIKKKENVYKKKKNKKDNDKMKKINDKNKDSKNVMMLNKLRNGIKFYEISREGKKKNINLKLGVKVDGKEYNGVEKKKKDEKKEEEKEEIEG